MRDMEVGTMWWMRRTHRGRGLAALAFLLGLLALAKLHAGACTGGPTRWQSVGAVTAESP